MSTPETEGFALQLTITRPELVGWLSGLPDERLRDEVERTLAAGHLVLTLMTASSGEETMKRFFSPVVNRMGELEKTIQQLLGATQKSQRLGELGETIVAQQLTRAFPTDQFQITAKTGHVADIHATFDLGEGKKREAIVEVKLYTNDVPTPEIDKFRKDLATTGKGYGLMVSLTSRLTGINGPVHVEEGPDYVAVYVPNAGTDGWGLLWGAAVLKSIMQYRARAGAGRLLPTGAIEQAWQRIEREVKTLDEVLGSLQAITAQVTRAREAVLKPLDELTQAALGAELRLRAAVERIQVRLCEELAALPQTGVPHHLLAVTPADQVLAALQTLGNDKRAPFLTNLYAVVRDAGLEVAMGEDPFAWRLLRDAKEIAKTAGTKTRLDLEVQLMPDKPVTFVPGQDEIKGTTVLIRGDKLEAFAARARAWLVG